MKTVICALNSKYVHSSLAPWYLKAAAEQWCACPTDITVMEGSINQPEKELLTALVEQHPDVVAFCCYIWNIATVERLVTLLRVQLPSVRLILGGPEVSFRAPLLLQEIAVDYIVCGEGERPFSQLLERLTAKQDTAGIPGVFSRDGTYVEPRDVTQPPDPYCEEYFERLDGRIAYLETSRGCPFSCAFCLSGCQGTVRFFELEQAKRNILRLAASGARTVKLVDRTFNCDCGRAYALFSFLIEQYGVGIPTGVCFHFEVAADLFDEQMLALLATAPPGLIQLEAGLQSFHEPTLDAVSRKTDLDRLCRNLKALLAPGNIHVHIDLIAGLPYEDFATFRQSFHRAFALRPHMLQLGFLKLLFGSRLREQATQLGYDYDSRPPYTVQSSAWIKTDELAQLSLVEDALDRLYNSGRFLHTVDYLLVATSLAPFDLFLRLGQAFASVQDNSLSLDQVIQTILTCFPGKTDVDLLRDCLVRDYLQSVRGGKLPQCLKCYDARLRLLKQEVKQKNPTTQSAVAILSARPDHALIADYTEPNPVTGHYPILEIALSKTSQDFTKNDGSF